MTDTPDPVEQFLNEATTIFAEYDEGYMDADAALRRLRAEIDDLDGAT